MKFLKRLVIFFSKKIVCFIQQRPVFKNYALFFVNKYPFINKYLYQFLNYKLVTVKLAKKASWSDRPTIPISSIYTRGGRLRLAFISPLPPEQSGIAHYSIELLTVLARYYDIYVIVKKNMVRKCRKSASYSIYSPAWLHKNYHKVDRIIYHFGNSSYHHYMLELLGRIPGIVVLHDFFLGDLFNSLAGYFTAREYYYSHGYAGVKKYHDETDTAIRNYPANLRILQKATGVIVHSQYAKQLGTYWYGENFSRDWKVIPMLHQCVNPVSREEARRALGLKNSNYLLCSFGFLGPTKLNHRVLEAWLTSILSKNTQNILVFIGEGHGDYVHKLRNSIIKSPFEDRIFITGWIDNITYQHYLAAADLAVQLRVMSRGETSLTMLDCMSQGLPVIVNANGSFAELSRNGAYLLPENFSNAELVKALEYFYQDKQRGIKLGAQAQKIIYSQHTPVHCAHLYRQAIEYFYSRADYISPRPYRQLLIDITKKESLVHEFLKKLLLNPPAGYQIEPVYLQENYYHYARQHVFGLLNCPSYVVDQPVIVYEGDLFVTSDETNSPLHTQWRAQGVKFYSYQFLKNKNFDLSENLYAKQ